MPMTSTSNMHPTRSGVEDPFAFGALERFSTTYGPERHILRIPLNGNIFIGRGLHNDLVLEDEHISWSHCKITYTASEPPVVTLTAMRTRNGTFVNGIRLKPEQTHNLNDDDLISLGTPVAPQKLSREDKNSVHIAGIYAERRQLRQIGWQFKFYRLTRAEVTQGAVGRSVHNACNVIAHSKACVLAARVTLARIQGEHHPEEKLGCHAPDIYPTERPPTPAYVPPPARLEWPDLPPFDFVAGRSFHTYTHATGLSWYHPDFIYAGEIPLLQETPICELPSAFPLWSRAYGLPQGLHPRWNEFSSLRYGDECRDIHSPCADSVLLKGIPAPSEQLLRVARIEENVRRRRPDLASVPAQYTAEGISSMSRRDENDRLYEENDRSQSPLPPVSPSSQAVIDWRPLHTEHEHPPVDMGPEKCASPSPPADALASEPTAAPPATASPHARRSDKRKSDANDDFHFRRSADSNTSTMAALERPRKRMKRTAHTNSKHATGSHTAHPSASTSARGIATSVDASRPLKRDRPDDDKHAEERFAKRRTHAVENAPASTSDAPSRRRHKLDSEEHVRERPICAKSDKAHAPAQAVEAAPRLHKRRRLDPDDEESTRKPPAKRAPRATSNTPVMTADDMPRSAKRMRPTAIATPDAPDAGARRSERLKSKAPTQYH